MTSMKRANTCANGRNNSVDEPSTSRTAFMDSVAFSARAMKLSWVSWQPLGRPVVPEV